MKLFSKIKRGLKKGLKALKICVKRNWIGIILCSLAIIFIPTSTIILIVSYCIYAFSRDTYNNFNNKQYVNF